MSFLLVSKGSVVVAAATGTDHSTVLVVLHKHGFKPFKIAEVQTLCQLFLELKVDRSTGVKRGALPAHAPLERVILSP